MSYYIDDATVSLVALKERLEGTDLVPAGKHFWKGWGRSLICYSHSG